MARKLAKGEKPLDWIGSSKRDFLRFPDPVKDEMGNALGLAQFGGKHPKAKPWKGQGPGVFEIVEVMTGTPTERCIPFGSVRWSTFCMLSRRNPRGGSGRRNPISSSSGSG
jgi:phage-related protein